jgi:hypothetical protein
MPTDLQAVFARRREAQVQSDADAALMLFCVCLALTMLVLLFASHGIAQAIELMGTIEF